MVTGFSSGNFAFGNFSRRLNRSASGGKEDSKAQPLIINIIKRATIAAGTTKMIDLHLEASVAGGVFKNSFL